MTALSQEQSRIISYGATKKTWEWVPLPEGRQTIPSWCKGLHIDWMLEYANSPDIRLKITSNDEVFDHGASQVCTFGSGDREVYKATFDRPFGGYEYADGAYVAKHPDGRCMAHYHEAPEWMILESSYRDGTKWEKATFQAMTTRQSEGYGGRWFPIMLKGGSAVILRGPWHGGGPAGYQPVTVVEARDSRGYPWHRQGGCFGLFISEGLMARLLAHFEPTCRLARVHYHGTGGIEPVHGKWSAPKHFLSDDERALAK